jgi:hypothetical protein
MSYAIRIEQVNARPIAVVRRHAAQSELPRVVPNACGLVWNALKQAGIRGGRHVAGLSEICRRATGCGDRRGSRRTVCGAG